MASMCRTLTSKLRVVAKALRTGYYWPTMHKDAEALIKACQECQVHKPVPRNPQEKLNPITSPWPFYKWGIDIAGPFPEGPGKVKFLIVAMDYFTKWIEAKPVATITGSQVKKFVWENIVCRFGLPGEIISDNGKQFRDNPFKDWCEKLCIQQHFASVKHPQTNGLVERANRSLGEGIKARLGKENKNWLEEISHVLWAHRTMIKSSNGDTPFSLTYGMEAVIPAEIGMPTFRTAEVDIAENDEALEINLDLIEEKREQAAIREAKSKRQMEKYYNTKVMGLLYALLSFPIIALRQDQLKSSIENRLKCPSPRIEIQKGPTIPKLSRSGLLGPHTVARNSYNSADLATPYTSSHKRRLSLALLTRSRYTQS
ncbi:reverse transcriptase domain-containing protein [Tanacetum coccineum]